MQQMFVFNKVKLPKKNVESFLFRVKTNRFFLKRKNNEKFVVFLVTAEEIYRTLKNNRDKPRRIICFCRDLIDIDELDSKYRDESHSLLSEIQMHLKNSIDSEDFYVYRVKSMRFFRDDQRVFSVLVFSFQRFVGKTMLIEKIICQNFSMISFLHFKNKSIFIWKIDRSKCRRIFRIKLSNTPFNRIR